MAADLARKASKIETLILFEPPTFRFSGRRDVRSETLVLVKLDELNSS
jgi:hypothetical protein